MQLWVSDLTFEMFWEAQNFNNSPDSLRKTFKFALSKQFAFVFARKSHHGRILQVILILRDGKFVFHHELFTFQVMESNEIIIRISSFIKLDFEKHEIEMRTRELKEKGFFFLEYPHSWGGWADVGCINCINTKELFRNTSRWNEIKKVNILGRKTTIIFPTIRKKRSCLAVEKNLH